MQSVVTWVSVIFALAAAIAWFVSAQTISPEKEMAYRRRQVAKTGGDIGGSVEMVDGNITYDLHGTLRHQGRWSRYGAIFTGLAVLCQAVAPLLTAQ
ncbi:hypothetical protein EDF58_101587 [Novosphingobium sp. PhB57]|uniref:hypothetical protein n=1 Tax=Novosphingobium sp. PhB57 TaxID=2485107 RepID=UPI00104E8258|nr:hypothetical protein [Novosphingobium sp. PhB57]TCU61273.1 hypothetical protein EDF58_101587 [Novosphingobium sp. PhB57]